MRCPRLILACFLLAIPAAASADAPRPEPMVLAGAGSKAIVQPPPNLRPRARSTAMDRVLASAPVAAGPAALPRIRPLARSDALPRTRWERHPQGALWTRAALSALSGHGAGITDVVPRDIADWCPAYIRNGVEARRAFWVGLISALSFYESTWKPHAVGGGGQWYGLMQIYPPTADFRKCRARSGTALKNPTENLSCAVRILSRTIPRDRAVAVKDGRWKGVAADWGPMVSSSKRKRMAEWTRKQSYCRPLSSVRPRARPVRG